MSDLCGIILVDQTHDAGDGKRKRKMFALFDDNMFVVLEFTYGEARDKQKELQSFVECPLTSCIVEVDRLVDLKHAMTYEGNLR